jgi:hypothetical protein
MVICTKFEDEIVSEMYSAEMEFCMNKSIPGCQLLVAGASPLRASAALRDPDPGENPTIQH